MHWLYQVFSNQVLILNFGIDIQQPKISTGFRYKFHNKNPVHVQVDSAVVACMSKWILGLIKAIVMFIFYFKNLLD